ncbi:MAG: hypothetical protein Ct9H300mP12_13310 [Acidimicrobiales bacterium]|nr:MAG: hypothetical protein Ct9H300mP12_13310 [Acidimicrobiales bacterium]
MPTRSVLCLTDLARVPWSVCRSRPLHDSSGRRWPHAAEAAIWGGVLHDVCVAGGAVAASAGELALFVGGRPDLPPAAAALLSYYSSISLKQARWVRAPP